MSIILIKDMDSFEINKIIAAVLLTALIIIGIGKIADMIFCVEKPAQSAYKVEGLDPITTSLDEKKQLRLLWFKKVISNNY